MEYLPIVYEYKNKKDEDCKVCFFLPKSFIINGDLNLWQIKPDNFLGVDVQKLLADIKED